MEGWIKIHRQMMEKGWWQDSQIVHLWIYILFKANYIEKEKLFNNEIIKIKRGQFLTGRKKISEETGISESKIERTLKLFESEQQIKQQKTTKFRLITVLKYDKYQVPEQQSEQQVNNKRTASEQPVNTTNELKKERKKEEEMSEKSDAPSQFDTFWNSYPKKELKKKSLEIWKRKKLDKHLPEILAFIEKAKRTDRWKKGFVKQPTTFLNNESWNDDLTSYGDQSTQGSPPSMTYKTVDEIMAEKGLVDEKIDSNHFDRSQLAKTFKHSQ